METINKTAGEDQLDRLASDNVMLREEIKKLRTRLGDAETALVFYAAPGNWKGKCDPVTLRTDSRHLIGDERFADNTELVVLGGRRAAEHLAKYGDT